MDEILNEESQVTTERPRKRRNVSRKSRINIPVPAFLANYIAHLGEDVKWYFDIRLYAPLILVLLILALLSGKPKQEVTEPVTETIPVATQQVEEETEPAAEPIDPDAEALAVLADSVGAGRSKNAREIIMWVAINRMEDRANGYGLSLQEEIERPTQWQGYDPNVSYSEESYTIAQKVLQTVANGDLRPLDPDMLWLVLNDNGSVTVRNRFTASANQKWIEKTVN